MSPYYLYRKGSMPAFSEVRFSHWLPILASNVKGCLLSDPQIDRWDRLAGNGQALRDVLSGSADPRRMEGL